MSMFDTDDVKDSSDEEKHSPTPPKDSENEEETEAEEEEESNESNDSSEHDHLDEQDLKTNGKKEKISAALPVKSAATKSVQRPKVVQGQGQSTKKNALSPDISEEKTVNGKSTHNQMAAIKRVPYQIMVDQAISDLNEKSGSSLIAIKKYIIANFDNISTNRLGFYVTKYLKKSVADGKLQQKKQKFKIIEVKKVKKMKPRKTAKAKPILEDKSGKIEKSSKTATGTASSTKVLIKTTALAKNASKEKEPKKATKSIETNDTTDAIKSQQPKKNMKAAEPSTSAAAASKEPQIKSKTKRALYGDKEEVVIPMKASKPAIVKPNLKAKEVSSKNTASKEPSSSKQAIKKKPNSKN